MSEQPKTICVKCKWFLDVEDPRSMVIWYNHLCTHPETQRPKKIDPVTGQTIYGSGYERPEPYARDINFGNCQYWEEK